MYQYRQNSNNTLEKIGKLLVVVGAILGIIAFILVLTRKSNNEGYTGDSDPERGAFAWRKPEGGQCNYHGDCLSGICDCSHLYDETKPNGGNAYLICTRDAPLQAIR